MTILSDYHPKTCGMVANNAGQQMYKNPVATNSSCDCAHLCDTTDGCEGWTYASGEYANGDLNCFLRSEFGAPVYNCDGTCLSGKKNATKW